MGCLNVRKLCRLCSLLLMLVVCGSLRAYASALTGITLSTDVASPRLVNTPINLTGTISGAALVEYRFRIGWYTYSGTLITETDLRGYSQASTFHWVPITSYEYLKLTVWVRVVGSTNPYDYKDTIDYAIRPHIQWLNVAISPANQAFLGAPVTISADTLGPQDPNSSSTPRAPSGANVLYRFRVNDGKAWTLLQDYSSTATCNWTPPVVGAYTIEVCVKENGSTQSFDMQSETAYLVKSGLQSVALTVGPANSQSVGKLTLLTAVATGGTNLNYSFYSSLDGSAWDTLRSYGPLSYYQWVPTATGKYFLQCRAETAGSGTPIPVVSPVISYQILPPALSGVSLALAPALGVTNVPSTVTATLTGGVNPEYRFLLVDGSVCSDLHAYSPSPTCQWTPAHAGVYAVTVYAREIGNPLAYQVLCTQHYTVYDVKNNTITAVNLTVSPPSPSIVGTPVALQATAIGGTNVEYRFRVSNGTQLTDIQPYSAANTCTWTPSASGSYLLYAYARGVGSAADFDASRTLGYLVPSTAKPVSAVKLAVTPASPVTLNTPVILTATPTNGISVLYRFRWYNGLDWVDIAAESLTPTCTWIPTTPGKTALVVIARESSDKTDTNYTCAINFTITGTPPSAPLSLAAKSQSNGTVLLQWPYMTGQTSFDVQRRVSGSGAAGWTIINAKPLLASATTYTDAAVTLNSSYDYRVRAVNAYGASAWGPVATVVVLPVTPQPIVTLK